VVPATPAMVLESRKASDARILWFMLTSKDFSRLCQKERRPITFLQAN
jgi:hypothetical protein